MRFADLESQRKFSAKLTRSCSVFYFQLYDRINTKSLSPAKSPPSDSVSKAREVSWDFRWFPGCSDEVVSSQHFPSGSGKCLEPAEWMFCFIMFQHDKPARPRSPCFTQSRPAPLFASSWTWYFWMSEYNWTLHSLSRKCFCCTQTKSSLPAKPVAFSSEGKDGESCHLAEFYQVRDKEATWLELFAFNRPKMGKRFCDWQGKNKWNSWVFKWLRGCLDAVDKCSCFLLRHRFRPQSRTKLPGSSLQCTVRCFH